MVLNKKNKKKTCDSEVLITRIPLIFSYILLAHFSNCNSEPFVSHIRYPAILYLGLLFIVFFYLFHCLSVVFLTQTILSTSFAYHCISITTHLTSVLRVIKGVKYVMTENPKEMSAVYRSSCLEKSMLFVGFGIEN